MTEQHPIALIETLPVVQADSDETLIRLWLHGRPETTQSAYSRDTAAFRVAVAKPLRAVSIGDLQSYADLLTDLAPASQARRLASVKSLFAFGHRLGYLAFDTARPLQLPRLRDRLAERIVGEADMARLIALEPNPRNHALLKLAYSCGLRISELCGLCWRDLKGAKSGGVATVHGKGGKTRHVLVQPKLWRMLTALKGASGPDDPVFRSREGGPMDRSSVHRMVKAAAARAGLPAEFSTHWMRHSCASHSMDNGCAPHTVAASLGHASLTTTSRYLHARPTESVSNYLPE